MIRGLGGLPYTLKKRGVWVCTSTLHKPTPSPRPLLNCPLECPGLCCLEIMWHSQQSKVVTPRKSLVSKILGLSHHQRNYKWKWLENGIWSSGLGKGDLVTWFPGQLVAFQRCRFAIDCCSGQLTPFVPASHLPHGTWSFPGWWVFFSSI